MLAAADIPIDDFLPFFAKWHIPVAFLVPTVTGHKKSIMDATETIRHLLKDAGVHDYDSQLQGPDNKARIKAYFVGCSDMTDTYASLYRPCTKEGDPRIWFDGLKKYCMPCNLLALIIIKGEIYVFNLSNAAIRESLIQGNFVYEILQEAHKADSLIAEELLIKLRAIHQRGFLPSITSGDPGVGDTLENALGISRNPSKAPDYRGIELKTTRLTREGKTRASTRYTLFAKTPEEGLTYREILERYGKVQVPRGKSEPRLQIYETLRCSRPNAYDLQWGVDDEEEKLSIFHVLVNQPKAWVSAWLVQSLREILLKKHNETFWIQATSLQDESGNELFRYDKVTHTRKPNVSILVPLIQKDMITADLAAHKENGRYRDHGLLFKIEPDARQLLFGESKVYHLHE